MIHTDEDDEFDRIAHEAKLKGQPYYFQDHTTDPDKLVYRKPSRIDDNDIQDYVRPWVGLTDKEIKAIAARSGDSAIPMTGRMWIFVGDIEAKLKEKNT